VMRVMMASKMLWRMDAFITGVAAHALPSPRRRWPEAASAIRPAGQAVRITSTATNRLNNESS